MPTLAAPFRRSQPEGAGLSLDAAATDGGATGDGPTERMDERTLSEARSD
jgi:hypothetical protein